MLETPGDRPIHGELGWPAKECTFGLRHPEMKERLVTVDNDELTCGRKPV